MIHARITHNFADVGRDVGRFMTGKLPDYAEPVIETIREDTAAGHDANGEPFTAWTPHGNSVGAAVGAYSPTQGTFRMMRGLMTGIKNLAVTGAMLRSLALRGKRITVAPEYEAIAAGQMFNRHWRYHHSFLLASRIAVQKANKVLADLITGRFS